MDASTETVSITVSSEAEKIAVRSALAMVRELESAARSDAPGTVLDRCEHVALEAGRELTRSTLEQVLQQSADEAQKKGIPPDVASIASKRVSTRPATRER